MPSDTITSLAVRSQVPPKPSQLIDSFDGFCHLLGEHGAIGYQMLLDGDHPEIDKSIRWPPLKQEAKEEVKDDNDEDDEDELDDNDGNYQLAYQQPQQPYYQPLQAQTHQLHNISPTPPSSTFMTPSTSSEGVQQQQRPSNRPLRAAVVQVGLLWC